MRPNITSLFWDKPFSKEVVNLNGVTVRTPLRMEDSKVFFSEKGLFSPQRHRIYSTLDICGFRFPCLSSPTAFNRTQICSLLLALLHPKKDFLSVDKPSVASNTDDANPSGSITRNIWKFYSVYQHKRLKHSGNSCLFALPSIASWLWKE